MCIRDSTTHIYRFRDWKQHHQLCRDIKLTPVHELAIDSLCFFILDVKICYICHATCTFLFIKKTWYLRKNAAFGTKKLAAAAILLFPRLVPRLFLQLSTTRHQAFLMYQNVLVWCLEKFLQHWVWEKWLDKAMGGINCFDIKQNIETWREHKRLDVWKHTLTCTIGRRNIFSHTDEHKLD